MTDKDYGGWCTNWAAYTVPQLWSFLQYESPDLSADQAGAQPGSPGLRQVRR